MNRLFLFFTILFVAVLSCRVPDVNVAWPTLTPLVGETSIPQAVTPSVGETSAPPSQIPGQVTVSSPTQISPTSPAPTPVKGIVADTLDGIGLTFFDLQGRPITELRTPGLMNASPQTVHIAGNLPSGPIYVPLVFHSFDSGGTIMQNVNDQIVTMVTEPFFTSLVGVPGEPIVAYSTAEFQTDHMHAQIFVSPLDTLSNAAPALVVDDPEGWAIKPLAIRVEGGLPTGVWYTRFPYGIGGDIVFEPRRGLYYRDINTGVSTELLGGVSNPSSLSADHTWLAYSVAEGSTGPLTIRNLTSGATVTVPLLASSDRGAGDAVFSPGNLYVAWLEGGGWTMVEPPTYQATLRVAAMDGRLILDLPASTMAAASGFTPVRWAEPVGWLDDQTLLIQVRAQNWDQSAVIRANISDGSLSYMAPGAFVGLLYP